VGAVLVTAAYEDGTEVGGPGPHSFRPRHPTFTGRPYRCGVATTVAYSAPEGLLPPEAGTRPGRPTPTRLRLTAALLTLVVLALLAATAASFMEARARADTVTSRSQTATQAGDLYFALADLDAEAARLVLLGDGDHQLGDGLYDGNQLSALISYNQRTAQVDNDLQALATDGANATTIASEITGYRSTADAAIGLDEFPGSTAGTPEATAIGFYGRAATTMQDLVLPAAEQLRNQTAAEATQAANATHTWAIAGLIGTLLLGVLTVTTLIMAQRRFGKIFRRTLNPALLAATVVTVALFGGASISLNATAGDASAAGTRLSTYLQVVATHADSYDADGTAVRSVLMPDAFGRAQLAPEESAVEKDLTNLGPIADDAEAQWTHGPVNDYDRILNAVGQGDTQQALTIETGTARGDAAFDFYDYDQTLQTVDVQRLSDFQAAANGLSDDVGPWLFWPWILAGSALLLIALAVRPRLAEYR
jgi:hypothetical protein